MFNLRRVLSFLWRFLRLALPSVLGLLALSLITELATYGGGWTNAWNDWRFWVSAAINMIPPVLVSVSVFWLAARFVRDLYEVKNVTAGIGFLARSRFGLPGFGPWMQIREARITMNEDSTLTRTGGPGHLVVYNDSAVVLERAGQLTRVVEAGFPGLEPFEKVYDIVDLQPKRWVYRVGAMTKDGIPTSWDAEVQYQIQDGGQEPTKDTPYPFSKEAVFKAATCKWNFVGRTTRMDWEGRLIIAETEGALRSILARWRLDQLVALTEQEQQVARQAVQQQLETRLREAAPKLGAKILSVKLDNLRVEDRITQEWIKVWQARWQRWSIEQLARGEAERIYLYETAKAGAQMGLIVRIGRALQDLVNRESVTPRIVLMRLFSVLDRADFAASSRVFFPYEAIKALESMRAVLAPEEGDAEGPNTEG